MDGRVARCDTEEGLMLPRRFLALERVECGFQCGVEQVRLEKESMGDECCGIEVPNARRHLHKDGRSSPYPFHGDTEVAEHLVVQDRERVAVVVIGERSRLDGLLLLLASLDNHRGMYPSLGGARLGEAVVDTLHVLSCEIPTAIARRSRSAQAERVANRGACADNAEITAPRGTRRSRRSCHER